MAGNPGVRPPRPWGKLISRRTRCRQTSAAGDFENRIRARYPPDLPERLLALSWPEKPKSHFRLDNRESALKGATMASTFFREQCTEYGSSIMWPDWWKI